MKIIVTGGTGFFGTGIVRRLRQAGHEVVSASRRASATARVDVSDPASCHALFSAHPDAACVVHAAALAHVRADERMTRLCEATNVEGTRHVAHAAATAGIGRFVFISSVMVYGDYDLPTPVTEATPARSRSVYGLAKIRGEQVVGALASVDTWILRMATMYAPDWLLNVRKRVAVPVIGEYVYFTLDPNGRRYSLCSRENGAETIAWALDGRLPPGTYNVAERHVYTQGEILRAVELVEGRKPHIRVPIALPKAALAAAALFPRAVRENAHSRYWKFCAPNVYSADRLGAFGLALEPDLLRVAP